MILTRWPGGASLRDSLLAGHEIAELFFRGSHPEDPRRLPRNNQSSKAPGAQHKGSVSGDSSKAEG